MRGSHEAILESIQKRLFVLPYTTTVLCGHGPITTIGEEMSNNPFVNWFVCWWIELCIAYRFGVIQHHYRLSVTVLT